MNRPNPSRRRSRVWRGVLAVPLIVCAFARVAPLDAVPSAHSFLWKATGKQGALYLAGSIHMLTPNAYPLNPAFDTAFKDTDLLVEEVDLAEMTAPESQMRILMRGRLGEGQSFDKLVSPATLALLNKSLAPLGPAGEVLKQFKPWMLAISLESIELQKSGFDPNLGLDKHFYDLAQETHKEVQGLETVEYQLSLFDEMTQDQQDRFLADTLKELATEQANVGKLATAWKTGDTATVESIGLADLKSDPVMYRRLLVERNRNWLPKIEALFSRSGRAFVIVGASHVVGPDGLLAMLKAKGYTLEQL